jgi:HSP20 family protein
MVLFRILQKLVDSQGKVLAMAKTDVSVNNTNTPAPEKGTSLWGGFRDEFNDLFDRFSRTMLPWSLPSFTGLASSPRTRMMVSLMPSVDVAETDNAYTITAELPGLSANDVDVSVRNGTLVIKGEKQQQTREEKKDYYLNERSYGAFQRSFALPDGVDSNKITAELTKGVLTVTIPKSPTEQANSKKIEVKAA